MTTEFSTLLKQWRAKRHLSQLQLALQADVSARHISFIETGRANPSTQMVAKLAKSLKMPMQDAIQAYLAAGFAPVFMQHPRTQADMTRIEQAIQTVLQNHRQGLPGAA